MKAAILAAALMILSCAAAKADSFEDALRVCVFGAATRHHVPPPVMIILLENEGGTIGKVSHNTNGTVDIGPFQINSIWIPKLAQQWHIPQDLTYQLVLHDLCSNAEAAAWILSSEVKASGGDLWEGVGLYHSANPTLKLQYLKQTYTHAIALMRGAGNVRGSTDGK